MEGQNYLAFFMNEFLEGLRYVKRHSIYACNLNLQIKQ